MQTVETLNEGLKRAYTLTITAKDIDGKVDAEVRRVAPQVRMPGFRPGKVPANLVRKMHGEAIAADALNSSIRDGIQTLIAEQRLRAATQPSVQLAEGYAPGKDAEVTVELEVLPDVPAPAIEGLKLERLTVPVADATVEERLAELAAQQKRHSPAGEGHPAAAGDLVVMDFAGSVDGVAFDGGTGKDMSVEIGSGRLIPGFEDQLVGVRKGDETSIQVTFPEDYGVAGLKGKPAIFALKITDVQVGAESAVDEDFAKALGLESLEQLRGLMKGNAEQELNGLTRTHMKRKLLDQLAAGHDFPVPPSMVEAEYRQIWDQLQHEAEHEADPAAARAELEAEQDDYRAIAERRVRLGLLLSEIGQANGVEVGANEMNQLVMQAAQQYPQDQRERFIEYIRSEPMAAAQLRAPLYEDKVVDFLFDKAEISDREVTREELEAAIESEDGFVSGTHAHDHDDPKPRKSVKTGGAARKKTAEVADAAPATAGDAPAEPAPVKKAAPRKVPAAKPGAEATAATEETPKPARKPAARQKKAEA